MLLLYGAGFLFVERYNRSRKPRVNSIAALRWSDALLIGVFQVLALIPGTSRSVRPFSAASSSARRARSPRNTRSSSPCP